MCDRQLRLMQAAHQREGDGDAVGRSTDTSRWSSPSSLHCGSRHSSDSEDRADPLIDKSPGAYSSDQSRQPKLRQKGKGAQGPRRQRTNTASIQLPKLPPIKPQQVLRPRVQSAYMHCIREHESQIFARHYNEARVLQGLLRDTRSCRDNLARQLQTTESTLLSTKASLKHLQLLSQDRRLLEREELTLRLNEANAELEEKDKRIVDLERNLELSQASFNRQLVTEQRKTSEARKLSFFLQGKVYQLNREVEEKKKEIETHNIYSLRFAKKGRESKLVQTDGLILPPTETARLFGLENTESQERLEEQESSVECFYFPVKEYTETEIPETEALDNHQDDTEICADTSGQNSCSEESLKSQNEGDCTKEEEAPEVPQELEEEQETEESEMPYISKKSVNATEPKRKAYRFPRIRRNYTFKQTIENLHNGIPANSCVDINRCESTKTDEGGDYQQWVS
ncbi:lebercilin-like protein isoform X3 [Acanthopagrus latus]|uniref:lebercilin-like protein isoform X3 n=1 Tax=Acanthopagrus latus TaxID=8177 RepID=UPI00187C4AE5|nr:lebercilin-like protein isoform X3 [Acanthopagrus latus]